MVAVGLLVMSACIGSTYEPRLAPSRSRVGVEVAVPPRFAISAAEPVALERERRGSRVAAYETYRWHFESIGDNGQEGQLVEGRYYRLPGPQRRPLVIVLPIWGRSTVPREAVRRQVQRRQPESPMHVVTLHGETYLVDWDALAAARTGEEFVDRLERIAAVLTVQVRDIRRLVAWAAARPEIDERRIALVGFSISAILGSTVMAVDPAVSAGVFVMGGGSLTDIFLFCDRQIERVRANIRRRTGWDDAALRSEVDRVLGPLGPIGYVGSIDPRRVLVVEAGRDECVPRASRQGLWEAMGRPARLTIDQGHRRSFYTMTVLARHRTTKRIGEFLVDWAGGPATVQ